MRARAALPLFFTALFLAAHGPARAFAASEKEAVAALPEDDRKWLDFVGPILLSEEKKAFLALSSEEQRQRFEEAFWKRREQTGLPRPMGPGYRDRYRELVNAAATTYDGFASDAGRMVVRFGEPDAIAEFPGCSQVFKDIEVWTYSALGGGTHHLFYRAGIGGPRTLWNPSNGDAALLQPGACVASVGQLCVPGSAPTGTDPACRAPRTCAQGCEAARLVEAVRTERSGLPDLAKLYAPPPLPDEAMRDLRASFVAAGAVPASSSPADSGSVVPAAQAAPAAKPAAPRNEKEALAALPEDDRKWLVFVGPIMLSEERKAFLELTQSYEREAFREEFWKRREKAGQAEPLGPGYRDRYEDLRSLIETKYDHWPNDAARMVLIHGEPASIDELEACHRTFRDLELWTYNSPGGGPRHYFFYRRSPGEPRRMWTLETSDADVFQPGSCRKSFQDLNWECSPPPPGQQDPCGKAPVPGMPAVSGTVCMEVCDIVTVWQEISRRQGSKTGAAVEQAQVMSPPDVSLEGLSSIASRSASTPSPDAKPLPVIGPGTATPAAVAAAQTSAPAKPAAAAAVPASAPGKPAAARSQKEAIAALPEDLRQWLDFVAPIILPEEKKAFLELTQPHEWEAFQTEFWRRRERPDLQPPLGAGYRYRYEELRRLADSQYDHWPNDAAAMVIRHGEPDAIDKLDACNDMGVGAIFRSLEIWTYGNGRAGGRKFFFYRRTQGDPRRLWTIGTPDSDVFVPGAAYTSFEGLSVACTRAAKPGACVEACDVYKTWNEIRARQGSRAGSEIERAQLMTPEPVNLEGLEAIKNRSANTSDPNASKLSIEGPGSTASAAGTAAGPAPTRRKLSKKEIQQLTDSLPQKYHDFLELVDLIITDDERQVFLQISDPLQKDHFIESFWRRRSTDPRGLRTDFKQLYIQRYQLAMEQFHNMRSDRAKIFLVNGPPDAAINIDCVDIYVPIQIWFYERIEALKSKVYLIFYKKMGIGPDYTLWLPIDGPSVLIGNGMAMTGPGARRVDVTQCPEYRTVNQAMQYETAVLGTGAMSMAGASVLFQPPTVETEGVDQILSMTTDVAANAVTLGVAKLIRFPDQRANKIGVDLSLLVPRAELKSRQLGEEVFYNVDVIGEVAKDDRLIDNFKYRFDIPTEEVGGEKIPLTVRRYLYPGEYKLILKVSDSNQNAEARLTEALKVPEQPDAPPPVEAAARAQGRTSIAKAQEGGLLPSAISLIPIAKEIATGLQRFETRAAEGVTAVDFFLNGSKVMTRTRAPFDADLNLGPLPRKQVIRVVAYGPAGRAVGEDEYIVNEGREVFRVRILTPEKGAKASGPTLVAAAVAVPEGRTLQKVEFYTNETRVATLYQSPWEQTINLKATNSLGYVRVVGTLEDGTVAEDVRYVNAPSYISEVSVDAVELYTTVTDKGGRPVSGLQQTSFKVVEDGVAQKIESFEYVKNVPISIGVLVDTSASMLEALPEAQKAAMGFLDYSLGTRDRGFTISFDNEPYILSKLTNRKDKLYRSLAGLRAEGSTALYDAVVYGLYQFTGVKGKKALVILSDGKDTSSKFDFDTLLDYVKKSGISIYAIGLKIPTAELDVKYKLNKLASVTGGQTFMIDSVKNLESVYRQINDELRSQYLLTYYSTNTEAKDKWRKVEVKVEPTNLVARTLSGYYP